MFVCSVLLFMHICIIHVESTVKDSPTLDAEEPGAEYQQEQQEPEPYEGAEQDQVYDYVDYTNIENPQGKHRFILTHNTSQVLYFMICWSVHLSS